MDLNKKNLSCDLLIAGGGIGGLVAAVEAKENNPDLDVIIVEKQVTGYGGKANKGGGVLQYFQLDKITPMDFLKFHVNEIGGYLGDQELMLKYVEMNHELLDKMDKWGIVMPRNEEGNYFMMPTGPFTCMISVDLDLCIKMRRQAEKLGVRIFDKVTVTDFAVKDGVIRGAFAYSILEEDNTFYTISASQVVIATGSQNYRVGAMWSSGRGDGIAAAYRAGAEMRNPEFGNFSQLIRTGSHGEVVFGENFMYNAKNEHVTKNFTDHRMTDISSLAIREWYVNMINGTGPIHLDYGPDKRDVRAVNQDWQRPYGQRFRECRQEFTNKFDNDLEVVPLLIGEQSCIKVDHDMQTTIKGLYAIGDASYCGSCAPGAVPAPPARNRGSGILNAVFAGVLCGRAVAAAKTTAPAAITEEETDACIEVTYAPLKRKEGSKAKEVIELIQQAMCPSEYSVYMKLDRMEEAEKLVKQARELSANLKADDLHDLLACHEAEAMVLSAEMHDLASKERKESRGWFLREDYPEMDNENWLKYIIIKNVDGKMTLSTEDVPYEKWPIQPPKKA